MVKRIYFKVVIIISLSALLTTCRLEGDIEALRKKLVENHVPSDVPSAPSAPALTVGDKQITVTWTAVHEATTYEVWLSTKNNSATAANMAVVSGTTVTLNNLTNGTTYYVWLKAKNSVGTSDFSPVTSGIPSIPITTAPQAPLTPTVSTSDGQITVTWTAVQGATAYEIWLGTENNSVTAAKRGEDVSGTSVTLTNLTNGTTYYVWVRAKNDTGTSGFSPVASGTPFIPVTAPQSPSTPAVSIGNEQITVTWAAVQGATAYEIWLGTENNSATAAKRGADVSGTSVTLTDLDNWTTYYVWIRAKNNVGTSGFSPEASGTPLGTNNERSPGLYRNNVKIGNQNMSASLSYISSNAVSGDDFYIVLGADESAPPMTLNYPGKTVGITLMGYGGERKITLNSTGSLFTVNFGVTLTLEENITLIGINPNTTSLIVNSNGTFIMNGGTISGNTVSGTISGNAYGGGIYVYGGTLTMNGGTISGNTVSGSGANSYLFGGGIFVGGGTLTMNGGTISGNTASSSGTNSGNARGGGIYSNGTFIMNGGTISGNTASCTNSFYIGDGGGIYLDGGTLTMNGGTISGNTAVVGGGISVSGGTITIHDGTIKENSSIMVNTVGGGGGIIITDGTIIMYSGTISGNTAYNIGGGISTAAILSTRTITMHGGTISGNTANNEGGGIYYHDYSPSSFKKLPSGGGQNSGIIYGNEETGVDANGAPLKNTADNSNGHAVFVWSRGRNTTAGQTDQIDTTTGRGLSESGEPPYGQ